jgi:hypothetical protein
MATTLFKDTTYSVFGLIEDIKQGEVALPDMVSGIGTCGTVVSTGH